MFNHCGGYPHIWWGIIPYMAGKDNVRMTGIIMEQQYYMWSPLIPFFKHTCTILIKKVRTLLFSEDYLVGVVVIKHPETRKRELKNKLKPWRKVRMWLPMEHLRRNRWGSGKVWVTCSTWRAPSLLSLTRNMEFTWGNPHTRRRMLREEGAKGRWLIHRIEYVGKNA